MQASQAAVASTAQDPCVPTRPRAPSRGSRTAWVTWALIVLVPIAAAAAALRMRHNSAAAATLQPAGLETIAWPGRSPRPTAPRAGGTAVAPVASLIAGLEQRLARDPGDAKGWALLAQSYAFLGDVERTESALAEAVALGLDEQDLRRRAALAAASAGAPVGPASSLR